MRIANSRIIDSSGLQSDSGRGFACSDYYGCRLRRLWEDVGVAVEKLLFDTSFADVCANSLRKPPLTVIHKSLPC